MRRHANDVDPLPRRSLRRRLIQAVAYVGFIAEAGAVRDAMADRLPPSIAERTRRGAQLPHWFELMTARKSELDEEFESARGSATCRELLDLDAIGTALREWPSGAEAHTRWQRTTWVYRHNLFRALLMTRYIRFFEAHAQVS